MVKARFKACPSIQCSLVPSYQRWARELAPTSSLLITAKQNINSFVQVGISQLLSWSECWPHNVLCAMKVSKHIQAQTDLSHQSGLQDMTLSQMFFSWIFHTRNKSVHKAKKKCAFLQLRLEWPDLSSNPMISDFAIWLHFASRLVKFCYRHSREGCMFAFQITVIGFFLILFLPLSPTHPFLSWSTFCSKLLWMMATAAAPSFIQVLFSSLWSFWKGCTMDGKEENGRV